MAWYTYGAEPTGLTVQQRITAFKQNYLNWKNYVLTQSGTSQVGTTTWRVSAPDQLFYSPNGTAKVNATVSEGIGYGMFVTAYCSDSTSSIYDPLARDIFDGLWRYYKYYKRSPSGLMDWHINPDGTVNDTGGATDGDEDVAMALVIMSRIFPSGTVDGVTYSAEATTLINAILTYSIVPTTNSNTSWRNLVMNGNQWGADADYLDPDFFAPAWYREFYTHTGNTRWLDIITRNYAGAHTYFYANYSTGMVPDRCDRNLQSIAGQSYIYGYNAMRFPWRIATDYLWNGADTNSLAKSVPLRFTTYIKNTYTTPANTRAEYQLNGTANGSYHNLAYISGYAAAAAVDSTTAAWAGDCIAWMRDNDTENSYFGRSVGLMGMLLLTGEMTPKGGGSSNPPIVDGSVPTVSITSPVATFSTITPVQTKTANSGASYVNSTTLVWGSNNTAGNLLTLGIATSGGANDVSTVTDTAGNTWVKRKQTNGSSQTNNIEIDLWEVKNCLAGTTPTITVTLTASVFDTISLIAGEFSGLDTSSPFDVDSSPNIESGFVQSHSTNSTANTAQTNELVIALYSYSNNGETLTASGYTVLNTSNTTQFSGLGFGYKTVSAIGTQSATFASSAFVKGIGYVATYKAKAATTVFDTIQVVATATDNVGVVGVQFKVDGSNSGSEVTSPPFQIGWDTRGVSNGARVLTAVARDAAGNSATSAAVVVNVSNVTTSPPVTGSAKFF